MFRKMLVPARRRLSNTSRRGITLHFQYHNSENIISRPTRLQKSSNSKSRRLKSAHFFVKIYECCTLPGVCEKIYLKIQFFYSSSSSTCIRSYERNRKGDTVCLLEKNYSSGVRNLPLSDLQV